MQGGAISADPPAHAGQNSSLFFGLLLAEITFNTSILSAVFFVISALCKDRVSLDQ